MRIDLNSDLGEGFGPWRMGDDAAMADTIATAAEQSGDNVRFRTLAEQDRNCQFPSL